MRIVYRESGGFTGLLRGCEVDTETLAPAERRRLEGLVRASGLLDASPPEAAGSTHELAVEAPGRHVRVTFDIASLPRRFEPLVASLQLYLEPRRP